MRRDGNRLLTSLSVDPWRNVSLPTEEALKILSFARWPKGEPAGSSAPVEVSQQGVSIYELIGAMQVVHVRRGRKLAAKYKRALRTILHRELGVKRFSQAAFEDLFERLEI